ncbi:MAG TPA: LegC family aminotransferase [Nitrosopumilaceae archaeon]|nr:LegC family aminotransferase [Nitrosopumilaceae archaeon]
MSNDFQQIIAFIRKIYHNQEGYIPLHAPVFFGNEKKYLNECIDTTFVSSVGKFVDDFELKIGEYTGSLKAVACVNGTNALHLALKLVGVKEGDEVIMQPLTFIATANAISYCNAHPVFVDVDSDTLGLSPQKLKDFLNKNAVLKNGSCVNKITGNKISACVPMHTFGHPCRIDEIATICDRHNIPLVEDAAESLGSFYKGKHTGTFGKIGILSFNGNKILTTGGGGMLLFKDEILARKAKHLSTQAKVPHIWEFAHDEIGYNYRMPNINAALGLAQIEQLPVFVQRKRMLANNYKKFFAELEISFQQEPTGAESNYWLNAFFLKNRTERDDFLKYSNEMKVMTRPSWTLMNNLPMFTNALAGDISNAQKIQDTLVNIPSSVIL